MTLFLQRLIDGISDGTIYGALGLALVLVFRCTRMINLAQGEFAMFGAYITWWLCDAAGGPGWPLLVALVVALILSFVLVAAVERVLIRPVEHSPNHLLPVVLIVALFLMIDALTAYMFGTDAHRMPSLLPRTTFVVGSVVISWSSVWLIGVLGLLSLLLYLLLRFTRLGLAMRAVASNPEAAAFTGVPVSRVLMVGWGLSGMVGTLAAVLIAPRLYLTTTMMHGVLLYAFLAIAIGGFDSFVGAVVGGLIVGVLETFVGGYIGFVGSNLKLSFGIIVLIAFLVIRPTGLFGSREVIRE